MSTKAVTGLALAFIGFLALIILTFIFTERVSEGKVAVVYSPNGGAVKVLDPGWHLIGFFQKTQKYNTRVEIVKSKVSVTTRDGKKVTMPARYEMKVDKAKVLNIFKELGSQNVEQIQEGYLYNKLFQASRSAVSEYSVLDIYGTKTTEASAKVTKNMRENTEKLGFIISDVTLGTPEVDANTQAAIDSRVKAAQENELKKQQILNAELEAKEKEVIANGNKTKRLIDAEAEAEANDKITKSITPDLLKLKEAEARLKHGWITVQGSEGIIVDK